MQKEDRTITSNDFNKRILKPSVIAGIKSGSLDIALCDPDCLDIVFADPELTKALIERIEELNKNGKI